jgi:hypothetical protein
MRALYQRRKGRDLFDLWLALHSGRVDCDRVVDCFQRYIEHDGTTVSRAEFEANLEAKLESGGFHEDVKPLIAADVEYDPVVAAEMVRDKLIARLAGEPWKGEDQR